MQTRYCAAATALLVTAAVGLAASGGAAEAAGTHHNGAQAAKSLTITIKSKAGGVTLSDTKFRPGNTVFKVKNAAGKSGRGLIQVLRLKSGYTLLDANTDFGLAFPEDESTPPNVAAINRIDDNVVFYGGMEAPRKKGGEATKWAVKIDKPGTYYVVNFDAGTPPTPFKAKGDRQRRALPSQDGRVDAASGPGDTNVWKVGKHNAAHGWMSTTNNAEEPHFVVLDHVKKSATMKQVQDCFAGPPDQCHVFAKDGASADTGVISPGHRFLWAYDLPKGKYLAECFWPSKMDGTPHALMGMLKFTNLG
jgi:hypothetical protein